MHSSTATSRQWLPCLSTGFVSLICRLKMRINSFCLYALMLYVPVNSFLVMLGQFPVYLGWTSKAEDKVSCFKLLEDTTKWIISKTVWYQKKLSIDETTLDKISRLLEKPTDPDPHCFPQFMSSFWKHHLILTYLFREMGLGQIKKCVSGNRSEILGG